MPRRLRFSRPAPQITDTSLDPHRIRLCLHLRQRSGQATTSLLLRRRRSPLLPSNRATRGGPVAACLSHLSRSRRAQAPAACTRTVRLASIRRPRRWEKLVARRPSRSSRLPRARPRLLSSHRKSPTAPMESLLPRLVRAIISCSHSRQTKVMYRFQWMCRLRRKWLMRSESATPVLRLDSERGGRKKKEKPPPQLLAWSNKSAKPTRTSNTTSASATTSLSSSIKRRAATVTSHARLHHASEDSLCKLRVAREPHLDKAAHLQAALQVLVSAPIRRITEASNALPSQIAMSADVRARTSLLRAQSLASRPSLKWRIRQRRIRRSQLLLPSRALVRLQRRCSMLPRRSPNNNSSSSSSRPSQAILLPTRLSGPTGAGLLSRLRDVVLPCHLRVSIDPGKCESSIVHMVHTLETYEVIGARGV